jgi:hypothetical protein
MFRIAGHRCHSRDAGKSSPTGTPARAAAHNGQAPVWVIGAARSPDPAETRTTKASYTRRPQSDSKC